MSFNGVLVMPQGTSKVDEAKLAAWKAAKSRLQAALEAVFLEAGDLPREEIFSAIDNAYKQASSKLAFAAVPDEMAGLTESLMRFDAKKVEEHEMTEEPVTA